MAQRELAFQGKKVNVHIETADGTEVHTGEFIAMDESGLLIKRRGQFLYFPPNRILMIGEREGTAAF